MKSSRISDCPGGSLPACIQQIQPVGVSGQLLISNTVRPIIWNPPGLFCISEREPKRTGSSNKKNNKGLISLFCIICVTYPCLCLRKDLKFQVDIKSGETNYLIGKNKQTNIKRCSAFANAYQVSAF